MLDFEFWILNGEEKKRLAVNGHWSFGKSLNKWLFLRTTIHDLQSTICYLLGGKNLSGRVGAAGPHRPTGRPGSG